MMTLAALIAEQLGHNDFSVVTSSDGSVKVITPDDTEITGLDIAALQAQAASSEIENEKRAERNRLLAEADIAINKAFDSGADLTALKEYRQALRDVPQQAGFPNNIDWPVMPSGGAA